MRAIRASRVVRRYGLAIAAGAIVVLIALTTSPASAQVDLSGSWENTEGQDYIADGQGPLPLEPMGVPLSRDGRAAVLSYNPETLEELQRQCQPYLVYYLLHGPLGARFSATTDSLTGSVIAWHLNGTVDREVTTIWMNGHAPPPANALHTFSGFTTGVWHGNTLVTTTTNLKRGFINRAGTPASDQSSLHAFWTRDGDLLLITGVVRDPIYLASPWVTSRVWKYTTSSMYLSPVAGDEVCVPAETVSGLSDGYHWSTYLPGKNPNANYMPDNFNIPTEAAVDGPQTMYPEYRKKLAAKFVVPTRQCTHYCCGAGGAGGPAAQLFDRDVLKCPSNPD
jgi:hypothetical protein